MASLAFQVLFSLWSILIQPDKLLRAGEGIGEKTRRAGKDGRGLQIETGVGPGSTGDPPVPSGDSPDGIGAVLQVQAIASSPAAFRSAGRRPGRASRPRYPFSNQAARFGVHALACLNATDTLKGGHRTGNPLKALPRAMGWSSYGSIPHQPEKLLRAG